MPGRDATTVRSGSTSVGPEAGKDGTAKTPRRDGGRAGDRIRFAEIGTREEFEEILRGNGDVIVYFTATWCGPCRKIWPEVLDIIRKMEKGRRPAVAKVDVDRNTWAGAEFSLVVVPTIVRLRGGREESRSLGGASLHEVLSERE